MTRSRSDAIEELRELVEIPLLFPKLYNGLSIPPPKAILLYGVTGSGKTYLIKQATERANARMVEINLSTIDVKEFTEKVQKETAGEKPLVLYLVMHNPESIDKEVISSLGKILDGSIEIDWDRVIMTGSSVKPALPSELLRPGRFDKELQIPLPNKKEREKILKEITVGTRFTDNVDLMEIAENTRGYTPADLIQVIKTAARFAIRREFPDHTIYEKRETVEEPKISISQADITNSIDTITPTVYKEFGLIQPNVKWSDIAGQYQLKEIIEEKVIKPIKYKDYFKKAGVDTINGVILYGPPGNGKTTFAKAIATEVSGHFLYINSSDFKGNSGNRLSQLFAIANEVEPTILFFDEVDSLIPDRNSADAESIALVNEFLTSMDGAGSSRQTLVIAATNYLDKLDKAALRPGRLELKLFVPPPDQVSRIEAFRKLVKNIDVTKDIDYEILGKLTSSSGDEVYAFSDLVSIVREAATIAARDNINKGVSPEDIVLSTDHFKQVIENVKPSLTNYDEENYKITR